MPVFSPRDNGVAPAGQRRHFSWRWPALVAGLAVGPGGVRVDASNAARGRICTEPADQRFRLHQRSGDFARRQAVGLHFGPQRGEGNLDIWVQNISTGDRARLAVNPADDYDPSFSPDGSKVVFRSDRDGGGIYTVAVLGGDLKLIAKKGRGPRFSPDGQRIVYWVGEPYFVARRFTWCRRRGDVPKQVQPEFLWRARRGMVVGWKVPVVLGAAQ